MGRPLRENVEGGFYHVTTRGNNRSAIALDADDCRAFTDALAAAVGTFEVECHAFCLMPNHYHLLVRTPRANLPRAMHAINTRTARAFNRRRARVGHVYEKRYHAAAVASERHLFAAACYVVLNPVRAGLCATPASWPWSSYRATAGLEPPPPFLTTAWLLDELGATPEHGRTAFRALVAERLQARAVA
jgi:putative transposase